MLLYQLVPGLELEPRGDICIANLWIPNEDTGHPYGVDGWREAPSQGVQSTRLGFPEGYFSSWLWGEFRDLPGKVPKLVPEVGWHFKNGWLEGVFLPFLSSKIKNRRKD